MASRRFNPFMAVLALLPAVAGQASAAEPATQPAVSGADIELGKPTKYPLIITPLVEGGVLRDNHHGDPLTSQEITFNPTTHELALVNNSPVPQRKYGNTRIDSANYKLDLTIFDYLTTDRAPIGKIVLTTAGKKIIISYNYVVSSAKNESARIDPSTYCALVQFEKGDESNKPGTTVTVRRNEDQPTAVADNLFTKINRKTDLITWTIERGGAVVQTGSFGFPVVATEPDLVKYVIRLP